MNNAEHESPCLVELAAAALLNPQRGLGTSGELGRGAGCFAGPPETPHPKYQPFLTPACVPTKPRGHLREMQLRAPQSILLTAAKPQSELFRAHWQKVRLGSGPRGNLGMGGSAQPPPRAQHPAGWPCCRVGSAPLRFSPLLGFGQGGAPRAIPAFPRGRAQRCAQTCGKWIVAGSCRVITLDKSLSMRSAANCHPAQRAADWGQAGRGTGCAPTADSLKRSRGNGDGSVLEQSRQDCAARAGGGEPRGCFCPQHPLLTRGFTACSPREPAGNPVPDPPKCFFLPQTASQKAGGEPRRAPRPLPGGRG